jgi:hypothetical protein
MTGILPYAISLLDLMLSQLNLLSQHHSRRKTGKYAQYGGSTDLARGKPARHSLVRRKLPGHQSSTFGR